MQPMCMSILTSAVRGPQLSNDHSKISSRVFLSKGGILETSKKALQKEMWSS